MEIFIPYYLGDSFKPLDYGLAEENLRRYGREDPADYDLSRVTAPVYVFWSRNDFLATAEVSEINILNLIDNLK